jgi:hypothetical protein
LFNSKTVVHPETRANTGFEESCMKTTAKKMTAKSAPMGYKAGGKVGSFKPCAGCPNAAKCKAMGKCMKKAGK